MCSIDSHVPQPPDHPTLLVVPTWYGGPPDEHILPLPAIAYEVLQHGDRTQVRIIKTGEWVYQGIGPAEVVVSRAPF